MIADFLVFCVQLVVFILVFRFALAMARVAHEVREHEKMEHLKEFAEKIKVVNEECVENMTYWWDSDNDTFIAQGKTLEEIVEVIKNRWPNSIFVIPDRGTISAPSWKFHPIIRDDFGRIILEMK